MATENVPAGTTTAYPGDLGSQIDALHDVDALLMALMEGQDNKVERIARIASERLGVVMNALDRLDVIDGPAKWTGAAA